jgi:large subunit ribosomal protein L21
MYAVITCGGKQHLVTEGQTLSVEKIELQEGETITFEPMLVASDDGATVKVGTPIVAGGKVTAKKISVIKYKPKVRYRRNVGHRQPYTKILIETIA